MNTKTFLLWIAAIAAAFFCWNWARSAQAESCPKTAGQFIRADVDGDGRVCSADAFTLVYYLVQPGADHLVQCEDAADANDDGMIDISDCIGILMYTFRGDDTTIAAPRTCGADPTADYLGCAASPPCAD
jgi:hypothetical protein